MSSAGQGPGAPRTETLGKYELLGLLGSGGMADVLLVVVRGPGGFTELDLPSGSSIATSAATTSS